MRARSTRCRLPAASGTGRKSGLPGRGDVKTHLIVQSIGICLLLMWTSVWGLPVTDAGGPPVHLAVDRQSNTPTRVKPEETTADGAVTQLIPTEIDVRTMRLIPPDGDSAKIFALSLFSGSEPLGAKAESNDAPVGGFLASHLENGPYHPTLAATKSAPWIVQDNQATGVWGADPSLMIRVPDLTVTIRSRLATVPLPASQRRPMATKITQKPNS